MASRRHPRGLGGAFTLTELLVVVVIISIMSVAILAEMHGTFQDALLRAASRQLAGAFNLASSEAISFNRPYRVRLDRNSGRWLLEKSARGGSDFFPALETSGSSGTLDPRIAIRILDSRVISAADGSSQQPPEDADDSTAPASLLAAESVTFYPDGTADARQIILTDRDGFRLNLRISPVTSRVQVTTMEHS